MPSSAAKEEDMQHASRQPSTTSKSVTIHALGDEHKSEVLSFLSTRPEHTVVMACLIRDNGLENLLNRGKFYACRDASGTLEGVALVGHIILFEASSQVALETFARFAGSCPLPRLIRGKQEEVECFWRHYAPGASAQHRLCRELLLVQKTPVAAKGIVPALRLATLDDLHFVMSVNAAMIYEESRVNPLETDLVGFRQRAARRIEQERVWLWIEDGRLIFKAEVMANTPDAIYIEGVHVSPEERGKGYGLRCMSQLGRTLLEQARLVCLIVNEQNVRAQSFYGKAGYKFSSAYSTIYLQQKSE